MRSGNKISSAIAVHIHAFFKVICKIFKNVIIVAYTCLPLGWITIEIESFLESQINGQFVLLSCRSFIKVLLQLTGDAREMREMGEH